MKRKLTNRKSFRIRVMKAISIDKIAILKRKRIVFGVTADLMNSSKSDAVVSNLLKSDQIEEYSRGAGGMGLNSY